MGNQNSVFQALADPTRREILRMLRRRDMNPSEIVESFEISKPSLSHHLDLLKRAGLVIPERQGQKIFYSLNVSVFEEAAAFFFELFKPEEEK